MTSMSPSQKAWNAFADSLKEIGEKIVAPTGARGGRERAEGYRYLLGLISAAQDLEMESDRQHPKLRRMMTANRKFKGDGTDTLYHEAKLAENLVYRMRLRRGDDLFFSATVYAFDEEDAYCPPAKQYWMLRVIRHANAVLAERQPEQLPEEFLAIGRMREWPAAKAEQCARSLMEALG